MNYREMHRIANDPQAVRSLAKRILETEGIPFVDRMYDFLVKLSKYDGSYQLNTRQLELLYILRDQSKQLSMAGPYKISTLVQLAFEQRLDLLDDESEEWLEKLHSHGSEVGLFHSDCKRLLSLCRRLDLLPEGEWLKLG